MTSTRFLLPLLLPLLLAAASGVPGRADEPATALLESRVRPLLIARCYACHGETLQQGGLRVDSRAALLRGGKRGPGLQPGKPEESVLLRSLQHTGTLKMPPSGKLASSDIAALTTWIRLGAPWPAKATPTPAKAAPLWSLRPVSRPLVPKTRHPAGRRNPIDAFILARQEAQGAKLASAADRRTLLRRVTYDLTGLPPTTQESAAFLADTSPLAYEKVVDRLLASPHYGEQWGRRWLDVVRYADTAGENSDHPLPHIWRYRNGVIDAFNRNKPYDVFLREQLAGDLLAPQGPPEEYANRVVATGFLALARRFGHDIDQDMHLTFEDTIDTLGKSVLGLSLGCARCHDHKFDPISTRDYYSLYGIFASTKFSYPGCEPNQQPRDLVPLVSPAQHERTLKPLQERLAQCEAEIKTLTDSGTVQARALQALAAKSSVVLSAAELDDNTGKDLAYGAKQPLEKITVRRGEVLVLSITPRGNHGADSTRVELTITETGGTRRQWSVSELISDLPAGNPHADRYGNSATWCFLDAQDGYRFLSGSVDAIDGQRSLKAWRNDDTPSVFVNTSEQPVSVWTSLPPRSFFMHPGPKGAVALAWLCPIDGTVQLAGHITDAHRGGDGVGWRLEQLTSTSPDATIAHAFLEQANQSRALQAAQQQRSALREKLVVPVAFAVTEGKSQNARIQKRGEPTDLGDEALRGFPIALGGKSLPEVRGSGRLELAAWLTDTKNPLTARVFVNRVWQGHFGRGLVKTPNDFGTRGTPPTHPELLDWLASEFIRSGWNIKALHRRIVLSATYRASSGAAPSDLYTHFAPRRLTAEELRDSLLAASGELDPTPGGSHPFPPEASWSFTQHAPFAAEYDTLKRSVYVMQKRNRRSRFFALFDGSDPSASTPVREVTTVPTQALFFLNDPFVHARAEKLATLTQSAAPTEQERVGFLYRRLFSRAPTRDDHADATAFLQGYGQSSAWAAYVRTLLSSNEFLYVD